MDIKRGRLIVFEGADGSGKATQSNKFFKTLLAEGHDAEMLDFPQYGKNPFAETVEAYLRGEFGKATNIDPHLASMAYAADRWKASDRIREGLAKGRIFVSNRYASANMGHQGAKIIDPTERRRFIEWCRKIEYSEEGFRIPQPDLTVLLDVDIQTSQGLLKARAGERGKERDGHERDPTYLERVAHTFREIATADPTWRRINCMNLRSKRANELLKPEVIAKKVYELVIPYLPPVED